MYLSFLSNLFHIDAMQMLGGNGYINDYPTGRIFRDAQLYRVGAGTQEIVSLANKTRLSEPRLLDVISLPLCHSDEILTDDDDDPALFGI